jgi:hypothetical protein
MTKPWVTWSYGHGGWVRFDGSDHPGPVYLRFKEDGGRLRVTEIYMDGRGSTFRSADLRQLDLSRLEALAASQWDEVAKLRAKAPGPDLARLASHYSTTWGRKATHWVADSFRAQIKGSDVPQAPMGHERGLPKPIDAPPLSAPEEGLTDDYLREVAVAYTAAVRRGERPAPTLAEQAGVSPRTVHAWIAKARDRGIMPRGAQGKVG